MRLGTGHFEAVFGALAVSGLLAAPATAQDPIPPPDRQLNGVVLDELTRQPVAGALVVLEDHAPGTVTDSLGHFTLSGFPPGPQVLNIRQFGYQELNVTIAPPEVPNVLVEIPLAPAPIQVDGVYAIVDQVGAIEEVVRRIGSRRKATAFQSRAYGPDRLVGSGQPDVLRFLMQQPSIYPTVCSATRPGMSGLCVIRRGRAVRPRVFIDELPAWGGLDELATYTPQELYMLEVYQSGTAIRAYTYNFMERLSRRPQALLPIFPR